jgi:hypothetical protein
VSAAGLIIRTIIIIPVVFVMLFFVRILWPILDILHAQNEGSAAVQGLFGGPADTAIFIAMVGIPMIAVALFVWHLVAPVATDSRPGVRRF